MKTTIERFWAKVDRRNDNECWAWTAGTADHGNARYGQFHIAGRTVSAHRAAYTLLVGMIPDGLQIDHLCRNTLCVNPAHLEAVTQRENILRAIRPRHVGAERRSAPAATSSPLRTPTCDLTERGGCAASASASEN